MPEPAELPADVAEFLREANLRIDDLSRGWFDSPVHGFVPCDFPLAYAHLREIARQGLAPGRMLCEWGSGFGVVGSMAAMLHYDVWGIEIEDSLVRASRDLAADFGLDSRFAQGNFLPEGSEAITDQLDESVWLATHGDSAYDEIGLDPADFDVIFTYSWPEDEAAIAEVFHQHAAVGALLLSYHGLDGMRLRRKVP